MVSTNIARRHNISPRPAFEVGRWPGRPKKRVPLPGDPAPGEPPSRPLPWSLQASGDQASLSRTTCVRVYRRLARGFPITAGTGRRRLAGFGPPQPRESSSSACKGLRALPVGREKMEDQGFCLLSAGLKSHFSPTREEWVLVLKCLPELRGREVQESGVGLGRRSRLAVWREPGKGGAFLGTHRTPRKNPDATGETEDRETQSLNYKPSGT